MTPEEFTSTIKASIVHENISMYKEIFQSTSVDVATDLYWKRALSFYHSLDDANQKVLFEIIGQSIIDTLSNVLGVLDGSTILGNFKEEFHLTYGDNEHELNGDLQDLFLGDIQESRE